MFTQYFLVEYQAYVTNLTLVIEVITISLWHISSTAYSVEVLKLHD